MAIHSRVRRNTDNPPYHLRERDKAANKTAQRKDQMHERYHDLDVLRAFLMIWVVCIHVGTLMDAETFKHGVLFPFLMASSKIVHMEAFMIVSGFFSLMMLRKHGRKQTISRRMQTIGVPFLSVLLLLNPVTNWLIFTFHNTPISFPDYLRTGVWAVQSKGPGVWHLHLWFLVPLIVYIPLIAPVAHWLEIAQRAFAKYLSAVQGQTLFLFICIAVPSVCLAARILYEVCVEPFVITEASFLLREICYYAAFYILGMALYRSKRLNEVYRSYHPLHAAASLGAYFLVDYGFILLPKPLAEAIAVFVYAYIALVWGSCFLAFFKHYFPTKGTITGCLADAAYTIFLFHYLFVYLLAQPLAGRPLHEGWLILMVCVTLTLLVLFHFFIVKSIPWAGYLFNGRLKGREPVVSFEPVYVRVMNRFRK